MDNQQDKTLTPLEALEAIRSLCARSRTVGSYQWKGEKLIIEIEDIAKTALDAATREGQEGQE